MSFDGIQTWCLPCWRVSSRAKASYIWQRVSTPHPYRICWVDMRNEDVACYRRRTAVELKWILNKYGKREFYTPVSPQGQRGEISFSRFGSLGKLCPQSWLLSWHILIRIRTVSFSLWRHHCGWWFEFLVCILNQDGQRKFEMVKILNNIFFQLVKLSFQPKVDNVAPIFSRWYLITPPHLKTFKLLQMKRTIDFWMSSEMHVWFETFIKLENIWIFA